MGYENWGIEPRFEASKVRLRDVLSPGRTVIDCLYDFGDSWEHRLTVTDIRQGRSCSPIRTTAEAALDALEAKLTELGLDSEEDLDAPPP